METDYPAAHSMDTFWYAIDADGCVGVFFTGENGHLPQAANVAPERSLVEVLSELRGGGNQDDEDDVDWDAVDAEAAERGMFVYEYIDSFCQLAEFAQWPYTLTREPDNPLHVDQLPPRLRGLFKQVRLPKTHFQNNERLQPIEETQCAYWYEGVVAYLAADEKTVKPIPGKEDCFAQFVRDFRQQAPKEAKNLIFEGLEIERQQARSPRKRRKKGEQDS